MEKEKVSDTHRKTKRDRSKRIAYLANQIMHHKSLYYRGEPEISDAEYDQMEDELTKLAPDHPVLRYVGAEPAAGSKKVEHTTPMLSLAKTYKIDELKSWIKSRAVVGMLKIDGASLSLIYRNGKLAQAKTRGNGRVGEEVTVKAQWVADILNDLGNDLDVEIRGELFCTETQFIRLTEEIELLGLEKPSSPRNIVAGMLGRKTQYHLTRFFNFFAFEALSLGSPVPFDTEHGKFDWLETIGFRTPEPELLNEFSEVESYLEKVKRFMEEDEIGVDGAVFSYDDLSYHDELGVTAHHPRYKLSFKWQGQTATSKIERIHWATSRLGVVTPVAVIEPVTLSGATITNVTLHNAAHVKTYNLKAGDTIEIVRSGEVIPKFLLVVEPASGKYQWPKQCSECHTELVFDDVRLRCPNRKSCPAQRSGGILNWIKAVEIDDLSEKRLNQMIELGKVQEIPDLYRLTKEDFLDLPQTKERLASKLYHNIQGSKELALARFLNGLGIEGAGLTSWEKLLETFPSLEKIQSADINQIANIEGFAEKSARQIVTGLKEKQGLIEKLLQVGVKPLSPKKRPTRGHGALEGKQIVITGALSQPRSEIQKIIKQAGGNPTSSVSKNTFAVVTNDPESGSSKMKKAKELGIAVWSEDELMKHLK